MESESPRWVGRRGVLGMLDDLEAAGKVTRTIYATPGCAALPDPTPENMESEALMTRAWRQLRGSETGVALFIEGNEVIGIQPPFPLSADLDADGAMTTPLRRLLESDPITAVVMLRLGRYAVGVLHGDRLVASKTATRHVKSRHRAGGQSQRRFERSRERLVREIYDKTCLVAREVISPYQEDLDHVLLGGDRHILNGFVRRCRFLQDLKGRTLERRVAFKQPNQRALESIHREVWKSRVVTVVDA